MGKTTTNKQTTAAVSVEAAQHAVVESEGWLDILQELCKIYILLTPSRLPDCLWVSLDICQPFDSCMFKDKMGKVGWKMGDRIWHAWLLLRSFPSNLLPCLPHDLLQNAPEPPLLHPCHQLIGICRASQSHCCALLQPFLFVAAPWQHARAIWLASHLKWLGTAKTRRIGA